MLDLRVQAPFTVYLFELIYTTYTSYTHIYSFISTVSACSPA